MYVSFATSAPSVHATRAAAIAAIRESDSGACDPRKVETCKVCGIDNRRK